MDGGDGNGVAIPDRVPTSAQPDTSVIDALIAQALDAVKASNQLAAVEAIRKLNVLLQAI